MSLLPMCCLDECHPDVRIVLEQGIDSFRGAVETQKEIKRHMDEIRRVIGAPQGGTFAQGPQITDADLAGVIAWADRADMCRQRRLDMEATMRYAHAEATNESVTKWKCDYRVTEHVVKGNTRRRVWWPSGSPFEAEGALRMANAALGKVITMMRRLCGCTRVMADTEPDDASTPGDGECSICMEKLEGNTMRTRCKHAFHESCLGRWIRTSSYSCPMCRCTVMNWVKDTKTRRSPPNDGSVAGRLMTSGRGAKRPRRYGETD